MASDVRAVGSVATTKNATATATAARHSAKPAWNSHPKEASRLVAVGVAVGGTFERGVVARWWIAPRFSLFAVGAEVGADRGRDEIDGRRSIFWARLPRSTA